MKKYIAPSVEILAINTENMMALSMNLNNQNSGYGQLSNDRNVDTDWDDED